METRIEVRNKLEEIVKELEKMTAMCMVEYENDDDVGLDVEYTDVYLDLIDIRNYIKEKQKKIVG